MGENKNTHADISGTGQGVAHPVNVFRENFQIDSAKLSPPYLERFGYKEGRVTNFNYAFNALVELNNDDTSDIFTNSTIYYTRIESAVVSESFNYLNFMRSISFLHSCRGGTVQTSAGNMFIDGIQTLNTWSARENVKGGSAPTATRDSISRNTQKQFELAAAHASGKIWNLADTRGIKNDMNIRLFDANLAQWEDFVIDSFVVNVSITTKKAPLIITAADVTKIDYAGFHNIKMQNTDGSGTDNFRFSAAEYEKLPLFESKIKQRISRRRVLEHVGVNLRGITNNQDGAYPIHKDGVPGNFTTSEISIIAKSSGGATFSIPTDLKNIQVSAGNIDLKIKSTREIYEDIDAMEAF